MERLNILLNQKELKNIDFHKGLNTNAVIGIFHTNMDKVCKMKIDNVQEFLKKFEELQLQGFLKCSSQSYQKCWSHQ